MVTSEKAIEMINEYIAEPNSINKDWVEALSLCKTALSERERLIEIAKRMHCWIFLHTDDEQKAYKECGLTDEENALFGYCGRNCIGG